MLGENPLPLHQPLDLGLGFVFVFHTGIHEKQELRSGLLLHPWRATNIPGDPANLLLMPERLEKELSP